MDKKFPYRAFESGIRRGDLSNEELVEELLHEVESGSRNNLKSDQISYLKEMHKIFNEMAYKPEDVRLIRGHAHFKNFSHDSGSLIYDVSIPVAQKQKNGSFNIAMLHWCISESPITGLVEGFNLTGCIDSPSSTHSVENLSAKEALEKLIEIDIRLRDESLQSLIHPHNQVLNMIEHRHEKVIDHAHWSVVRDIFDRTCSRAEVKDMVARSYTVVSVWPKIQ